MILLLPVIDWFHLCSVGLIEKVLQSRSGFVDFAVAKNLMLICNNYYDHDFCSVLLS